MRLWVAIVIVSALSLVLPGRSLAGDPVVTGNAARLEVTWSPAAYQLQPVDLDGVAATRVELSGRPLLREAGLPEVPLVPVTLAVPPRGAVQLEILEHRTREIIVAPVTPSLGHIPRNTRVIPPAVFGPFYQSDETWPVRPVVLGRPFLAGLTRGVNLRLQPVRYDAGRGVLVVTEFIRLAVVTTTDPGVNERPAFARPASVLNDVHAGIFANDPPVMVAKASTVTVPQLLVVVPDAMRPALASFVDWKTRRGLEVELVSPASLGSTAAGIALGIAERWAQPAGLDFVLLVGDKAQVPTLSGNYEGADSDQSYALLAGDDLYPDLFVSRLPARNEAELQVQVARILAYERDLPDGGAWLDHAAGIASDEGSPADHLRADDLRDDLLAGGFGTVDRVYQDLGAGTVDVRAALSSGRSFINYLGHGSGTAWQSVPFDTGDVRNLDNSGRWPWIVDASCSNGDFALEECLAEAWLRAGTVSAPAGAVGVLAATTLVPWTPPIHMQGGIVDALTNGGVRSLGALTWAGLARVLDIYGGLPVATQVVEQYVLFGDASLLVRTRTPRDFQVTVNRAVGAHDDSWLVKVDGAPGSVVALTADGMLLGRGVVDADGWAEVALLGSLAGRSQLDMTATGPDMMPWLGTVEVVHGLSAAGDVQPAALRSLGNHPNPFNPVTMIACELAAAAPVHVAVFDLAGRRVRTLASGTVLAAGHREFTWDGRDDRGRQVGSGIYLYRLTIPRETVTGRMTLIK